MHFKGFKKAVTAVLALTLVSAAMLIPAPVSSALSTSEMKSKISEYEKKATKIKEKIKTLEGDKKDSKEVVDALNEKIENLESQISLVNDQISSLNKKIKEAESQIKEKEDEIDAAKDILKKRLRAIYVAGTNSELQVLLSADNYSDYLSKAELMRGVTDYDTQLMEKLNGEIADINKLKADIESDKKDADSLKQSLVSKQKELDEDYQTAKNKYNNIVSTQNSLESEAAEVAAAKKKVESEWAAAIAAESDSSRVLSDYNFAWPFQNSYYFSCNYGQQSYRFHTGVDITCSGAYGKPIYAIADGKVIRATYSNVSYGNCMIIDHGRLNGNQYSSLYAHCSSLLVSYGQEVKKGQLIGYVGSTGNSTGPHLHFEIRVNGSHVNPLGYYRNY